MNYKLLEEKINPIYLKQFNQSVKIMFSENLKEQIDFFENLEEKINFQKNLSSYEIKKMGELLQQILKNLNIINNLNEISTSRSVINIINLVV